MSRFAPGVGLGVGLGVGVAVGVGVGDAVTGAGVGEDGVAVGGAGWTSSEGSVGSDVAVGEGISVGVTGAGVAVITCTTGVFVAPKAVSIDITPAVSNPNRIITAQPKPKIEPINIHCQAVAPRRPVLP